MAAKSEATATSGETPAPEVAQTATSEGFKAVTLYNRLGEERVVESVGAKVQAEFEGYGFTSKPKPVKN